MPPIKRPTASTTGVSTPARPNTDSLTTPMTMDTVASVAITAAPSRPVAISSDNRMTPAPVVPPTRTPQPAAAAAKPFSPRWWPRLLQQPAQRHGRDQARADHQRRAAAGEQRIEPGAEHAGRHRRDERDHGAPQDQRAAKGDDAGRIGEHRRHRNDRHHRRGAQDRHQHQRHQRAGAIAGDAAGNAGKRRQADDQQRVR